MDYRKIYMSIILRAIAEKEQRLFNKRNGVYYENHHIIPRSLNGSNLSKNLVLLTGKEHFICHWLLVKIYPKGSIEYAKMLYALWRMRACNGKHAGRYINSKTYEYYRTEFSKYIGEFMHVHQAGKLNSQYGQKWYTSAYTGESKTFLNDPGYPWCKGRYLFNGQTNRVVFNTKDKNRLKNPTSLQAKQRVPKIVLFNKYKAYAETLWDNFHKGNYTKLEDFSKTINISKVAVYKMFSKYIPKYKEAFQKKRTHYTSNASLVGVYK